MASRSAASVVWCFLVICATAALLAAAVDESATESLQPGTEANTAADDPLEPGTCAAVEPIFSFPSNNTVTQINSDGLSLLLGRSAAADSAMFAGGLFSEPAHLRAAATASSNGSNASSAAARAPPAVLLFHSPMCPHSRALRPLFHCLPAFFPPEVRFVEMDQQNASLLTLMGQGLHSMPVLQVLHKGKKYRYSGERSLHKLVAYVASTLAIPALSNVSDALVCSEDGGCAPWRCERTEGGATREELRGSRSNAAMLAVCVLFLCVRFGAPFVLMLWRRRGGLTITRTPATTTAAASQRAAFESTLGDSGGGGAPLPPAGASLLGAEDEAPALVPLLGGVGEADVVSAGGTGVGGTEAGAACAEAAAAGHEAGPSVGARGFAAGGEPLQSVPQPEGEGGYPASAAASQPHESPASSSAAAGDSG